MVKDELLKAGSRSAVGSTRQRARDSMGKREESESRECSAASLVEDEAREGGGEGNCRRSSSEREGFDGEVISSGISGARAVAVDCRRVVRAI